MDEKTKIKYIARLDYDENGTINIEGRTYTYSSKSEGGRMKLELQESEGIRIKLIETMRARIKHNLPANGLEVELTHEI